MGPALAVKSTLAAAGTLVTTPQDVQSPRPTLLHLRTGL